MSTTDAAKRRWEHNSDKDKTGYVDLAYKLKLDGGAILDFSAGGMYRDKKRDSFFNEYTFNSATGSKNPQYINKDWFNFDEIQFVPRPYGNIGDPLNYDATEKIGAGYGMVKYTLKEWELIAGVRVEHTNQGYVLKFPRDVDPEETRTIRMYCRVSMPNTVSIEMPTCVSRMRVPSIVRAFRDRALQHH